MATGKQTASSLGRVLGFLVLVVVIVVGYLVLTGEWDLGEFEESGWVHHDKMTTIYSHDWTNGEYKECTNVNAKTDEPILQCDDLTPTDHGKVFKVRFYGRTYVENEPLSTTHHWECRKNGDTDPVITCNHVEQKKPEKPQGYWVVVDESGKEYRLIDTDKAGVQTLCESHPSWKVIHDPSYNGGAYTPCPGWISLFGTSAR